MADEARYGLSRASLEKLQAVFRQYPEIERVILFGSRADSTYRDGSDIDIAVSGNINFDLILKIRVMLDSQNLPYKIDLLDYNSISEPVLKHEIDKKGILLYEKAVEL